MPDQRIDQIPLPDQLPAAVDVSNLPKDLLHASTVESLLTQNQDLMTRLSVNIRRVADLEIAVRQQQELVRVLEHQREALREEFEVINEKYRALKANTDKVDAEKSLIEKRYAEIQTKSQAIHERLLEENYYFRGVLFILHNYHRRIKKYVRPLLKQQARELDVARGQLELMKRALQAQETKALTEIGDLRHALGRFQRYRRRMHLIAKPKILELQKQIEILEAKTFADDESARGLREQIDKLTLDLSRQQSTAADEQARLVAYHEQMHARLTEECARAREDLREWKSKAEDFKATNDFMSEHSAVLENRAIRAERTLAELAEKRAGEIDAREAEIKRLGEALTRTTTELEELRAKDAAAGALNRRLGSDLSALRKENEQLRLRLRQKTPPAPAPVAPPTEPRPTLGKIEKIFAEIQSGFANGPEAEKPNHSLEREDLI